MPLRAHDKLLDRPRAASTLTCRRPAPPVHSTRCPGTSREQTGRGFASVDPVRPIGFIRGAPERAPVAELVDAPDSKSGLSTLRRLAQVLEMAFDFRGLSEYGKTRGWRANRARCNIGAERAGARGDNGRVWRNW
jgi:hypothetical protein